LAKEATKTVKVDGFRAGKVPVAIVKKLFGDKLKSDAEGKLLEKLLMRGIRRQILKRVILLESLFLRSIIRVIAVILSLRFLYH